MDIEPRLGGLNSRKSNGKKRYRSTSSRSRRNYDEGRARRDRDLNVNAYKEMIDSYLKNSNKVPIQEEEARTKDPWMKTSNMGQNNEGEKTSQRVEEEELSEMDKLWQEMEEAMTTCLLEETKDSNVVIPAEKEKKSNVVCPHNYRLYEEIGICCIICGDVKIEIKRVFPPFNDAALQEYLQRSRMY